MIPDSIVDEVRARADVVDIIGEQIPLKRAGREFRALCPFHQEKTPSFYVVPAKGFYKCFGCGEAGDVFTGDTLFAAGCGRLFEGTPAQMYRSLTTICDLPAATRLWFGHEYTASNLRFAASVEPGNRDVAARAAALPQRTTPTTVELERATNPFVRARDADELAERRAAKDSFK